MEKNKEINKLTEEDKNKLKDLLSFLRSNKADNDDPGFLCTHCHCRVCTSADRKNSPLSKKKRAE